jgi:hypothetical protein
MEPHQGDNTEADEHVGDTDRVPPQELREDYGK